MQKNEKKKIPKIVVIGGGTGVFTVLSGLIKLPLELSAVVNMADDGGSTGVLREEFGILPPGDIRRALVAMASSDNRLLSDLFNYRFAQGGLKGHTFGNIMLTALERITGSFSAAVNEAASILGARGRVIPATLDDVRLLAELEDGSKIYGETNIDIPKHDGRLKIKNIQLYPTAHLNPQAKEVIVSADMIIIGPGDLYTSVLPNLIVKGMREAIKKSVAKKVYVVNIMTKWGETYGFGARDFIETVEKYLGQRMLDYAIINTKRPSADRLKHYEKEHAEFVVPDNLPLRPTPILGDFLRRRGFIRHDPDRLAKVLVSLL